MRSGARIVLWAWAVLCAANLGLSAPDIEVPGLQYDEALHATEARGLLTGDDRFAALPGRQVLRLGDVTLPWMAQGYLGSLKSYLLAPAFALFGASVPVLRLTTIAWSLAGLLLAMEVARRLLGTGAALAAGTLLAFDPSFLFMSRHDWGPFTPAFLCRMAGVLLVLEWNCRRRPAVLFAAGLVSGLGIYHKADFAPFLAAAGLGLVATRASALRDVLRGERASVLAAAAGLALGALPMLPMALPVLRSAPAYGDLSSFATKLDLVRSTLDGSYFHRLMERGGVWSRLFDGLDAPATPLGQASLVAALLLLVLQFRRRRDGERFILVAGGLLLAGLLALPGAAHAHHFLNLYPFPHFVVAAALAGIVAEIARVWPRARRTAVAAAAVCVMGVVVTDLVVTRRTIELIQRTGGRGWWSEALVDFARGLRPGELVVSLDWSFHEQLLFLTSDVSLVEPFWRFPQAERTGGLRALSPAGTIYLVHPAHYDRFGYGAPFLAAVAALPPGTVVTREHRDREGELVFLELRVGPPHTLIYERGFRILLEDQPPRTS